MHSRSTALEIIDGHDLTGYEVIVTGGGSGIGVETVRAFAKANARVIIAARDVIKANQVADEIIKSTGNNKVEVEQLDLASLKSVRAFVERFLSKKRPLNILVNNSGIVSKTLNFTEDGFELTFGTNYIGHFVLTKGLIPALKEGFKITGRKSRVVCLSSTGHIYSNINLEDPNYRTRPFDKYTSYGQSKTAVALLAVEIFNRFNKEGITAFAVHPGGIRTPITNHFEKEELIKLGMIDENGNPKSLEGEKTLEEGASTTIWASVSRELEDKGGLYLEDNSIGQCKATFEEINANFTGNLNNNPNDKPKV